MKELIEAIFIICWIAGVILAKGFWSTFFAVIIPLWAGYLVIEHGLIAMGWIVL